jgi:hypothetical protein
MSPEQQEAYFQVVAQLLYTVFPKQVNGISMRNEADQCKEYVQHVLVLCALWQIYKFRSQVEAEKNALIKLLANCGW